MIEATAAGSITDPLLAAAIAGIGSPAILWLALKGKLDDRYVTKEQHQASVKALNKDINDLGAKQDAMLTLYNQARGEVDNMRDRCTKMEAQQNPVAEGVRRMEEKLDEYLNRTAVVERVQAVQNEQIKTLFNQRGGTP